MGEIEKAKEQEAETSVETDAEKKSPVKKVTAIVLIIAACMLVWYISSDRHVPYTDQAKINGLMIPISPRVAGNLTAINIQLHSYINVGDTLFQIDRRPFELAVAKAEANLDNTGQHVAARTSSVKSAAGRLGVARAQLDRAQRNWDRVQLVLEENPGALSQSDRDQSETSLMQAVEQVASAEADLEKSQQSLGVSGEENPQFIAALQVLEQAQLDLAFTTILATVEGYVESFSIDIGYYAAAGQPLITVVSNTDFWIQANMKENNISQMNKGDKVEFILDVAPGKVFEGTVRSIGHGVSTGNTTRGDLPKVSSAESWLRDPQRFPVIITFDQEALASYMRLGGQVDAVVYTSDHGFLNATGKFRIRLMSFLSYAR